MTGRAWLDSADVGAIRLPPLGRAAEMRADLGDQLYGPIPPAPEAVELAREPLPGALRVILNIPLPGGAFTVDAALWVPEGLGPWPVICGLDFLGPAGVLQDQGFPLDPHAVVHVRPELGAQDGRLCETLRGTSASAWPVSLLAQRGYAVLLSCYGSWVPDCAQRWLGHGLKALLGGSAGAISLWAWGLSRLVDVATRLPELDGARVAVAGHSRLGKAALWAAANDARIAAVFANQSGAAGAAPEAHPIGETRAQLRDRFPHWLRDDVDLGAITVDQNALLSAIAPRAVYLGAAAEDLWADPVGSYVALGDGLAGWPAPRAAVRPGRQAVLGTRGFHLRPGGHALLPYDWRMFLGFLDGLARPQLA